MIILRLQGLPWSATAKDIRQHFEGLTIPDGGVHIIGGEEGDVFIAFGSDDDARKAMQRQKQPLNGSRIMLLLSSKSEMQEVIAESRAAVQNPKPDPFSTSEIVAPPVVPQAHQRDLLSREGSVTSSHSQNYPGFSQGEDQRRQPTGYVDSYQSGNANVPNQSLSSQGYGTSYPPLQSNERLDYGQSQNQMYGNDRLKEESFRRGDSSQNFMYQESDHSRSFNPQERNLGFQRREDLGDAGQVSTARDSGYPQESTQFKGLSQYDGREGRMPSADVEDQQYRSGSYGSATGPRSTDRDMPYGQGNDKPRSLLPSPGLMKSDEGSYQEPFDDPMEGISTSYPPAGPADKFDYHHSTDADQRGNVKQNEAMDSYSGLSRPMSTYGRQDLDKESDKGRYIRTPYEDAYWATGTSSTDVPSESMQGIRPDDNKSFSDNQSKQMTEIREDYYQSQGSNLNELAGNYADDKQYGSTNLDRGHFSDQKDKPNESFGMDRSQSAGYPVYPDYRSGDKSSDFDSRLGDVSDRTPLLNQEPPISLVKGTGDNPSSDSQMLGSRMDEKPPIPSALGMFDHPTSDSPYGSNMPSMEPSHDEFYGVRLTGLPFDCNERDVRLFLRNVDIAPDGVQIHRDHRGYITGTANIKLQGPNDIDQALKRHQQYMGKRYIDVRPCMQTEWKKEKQVSSSEPSRRRSRSPVRGSKSPLRGSKSPLRSCNTCIEMRGIASFTKSSDIVDFFEGLAMRQDSIFLDPNKEGMGTGVAYVDFVDPEEARKACQKNGRQFNRRTIAIRIISKEIMDAKITGDIRRRSERRSPGRRSPDRRRGSSPYSRRGRSPSRRGRSSPVRSSSRSSPGRNGPGRKQASPSRRDNRDRDRESSRQSRRAQSPSRHSPQDRKDSTEKKDRKNLESKEVRSLSKVEEVKSRGSPKTEDKDRPHKSGSSKDATPKALLPSPDLPKMKKEKETDRALLKTPEHPASDVPAAVSLKQQEAVPSKTVTTQQDFPKTDSTQQAPVIDFHAIRDAVSRFSKDTGKGGQDPVVGRHGVPDNIQGQMGMPGRLMGDNRTAQIGNFPTFTDERPRQTPDEYRERPMDLQRGLLDNSRNRSGNNGQDGPTEMHPGPLGDRHGGPGDNRQDGPKDMHHRPLGNTFDGPGDNRRDGPMDMHRGPLGNTMGGPGDNRRDGPMDMLRGPLGNTMGGPGDNRRNGPMDMLRGPLGNTMGGPEDNRRDGPMDMHRGPVGNTIGGPGDNRRDGPMDMHRGPVGNTMGGPGDNRRDGPMDMHRGPLGNTMGGPGNNRRDGPMDMLRGPLENTMGGPGDNRRDGPMDIHRGPLGITMGGPGNNMRDGPMDMQRGPLGNTVGGPGDNRQDGPMDMQRGPLGNIMGGPGDNRRDGPMDMHRGPLGNRHNGPGNKRLDGVMDMQRGPGEDIRGDQMDMIRPFGGPGNNRRDGPMDSRREGSMPDTRGMRDSWQGGPRPGRQGDERGGNHMQNTRERSLEDWRQGTRKDVDGPMEFREGRPNEERRRTLLEDKDARPHGHHSGERRALLDRPESPHEGYAHETDIDRRRHGSSDRQDINRMNERGPAAMNRRDSSPRRWTGNQSEERFSRGGFGFPEQGPGNRPSGRNGPVSMDVDRDSFSGDRRNLPPQQNDLPFPQGRIIPGLLDGDEGEMKRKGHDNQGPKDPHGRMERQPGHEERPDYRSRSRERGMHEPGEREQHHNVGAPSGPHGRPEDDGVGQYVCAHIRNVPYSARWPDFAQFFSGLQIVPGGIHIMVNQEGRPSGHCFIEFTDSHNARLTEERRLHTLKDRPLQINACSKTMMIRALEKAGEMMQNRPQHFAGRGRGSSFGPRGPRFQGDMRGPFPGPGSRHNFGPRGPPPGGPFRPPFGEPHRMDDRPPQHAHGPDHPSRHPHGSDQPSRDPHGPGRPERPSEERDHKKPEPSKESTKPEPVNKGPASAPKATPEPPPKKPQPEKPKDVAPEVKDKTPPPKPTAAPLPQHKGCVVTATNLPLTITVDSIGDFFKGFNTMKGAIKLDTNEATGKATGQAKIVFTSPSEANRAIKERNNRPLNGRIVRLHVM